MKQDEEAVSPVIGVILMVAITVVLAAIVFMMVSDLGEVEEKGPNLAIRSLGGGEYQVVDAPAGLAWEDFDVVGCDTVPTGVLSAGDRFSGCEDDAFIRHTDSGSLVWSA